MPMTRRSTGGARAKAGPAKGQSTISFASKVTKSTSGKDAAVGKAAIASSEASSKSKPSVAPIISPDAASSAETSPVPSEPTSPVLATSPAGSAAEEPREKTEFELRAEKVSATQLKKYWRAIEAESTARRVHQEDLETEEQILRHFDMSSEYGPCVGILRMKRWQRAQRLGLNPPVEVLAVLMQDEKEGNTDSERAHVDTLLNPVTA